MACGEPYATPQDYIDFFCLDGVYDEVDGRLETFLAMASSDVDMARAQTGACDCSLTSAAETFLSRLTCVIAAVIHNCPCGEVRLSDQERQMYLDWATVNLNAIRTGNLELCYGETGADWPAAASVSQNLTDRNQAIIILNRWKRGLG